MIYRAGRILQLLGLAFMPSSMAAAQFAHDERGAIAIFCASLALFAFGYFLVRISK